MIDQLPPELMTFVISNLSNRDIKNLRLTCTRVRDIAPLRMSRVFISPNRLNIQVFREVAQHDVLRHQIIEIIYDDARLCRGEGYDWQDDAPKQGKGVPRWYSNYYKKSLRKLRNSREFDVAYPSTVEQQLRAAMGKQESYKYFSELLRQEDEVISSGDDAKALAYGLERFPNLKRITLTPITHGQLYAPFFETPMIRAFPSNFAYPTPEPWRPSDEERKQMWRGFRLLSSSIPLPSTITELLFEVNRTRSGVPAELFDEPNPEYDAFLSILKHPGFSRLDLALLFNPTSDLDGKGMGFFRRPHLRNALAAAPDLRHLSLTTNHWGKYAFRKEDVSLQKIFPFGSWLNLYHFGLVRFPVVQDELVAILAALTTVRSVELSYLHFKDGSYAGLLEDMRATDKLKWSSLPEAERRRITIHHAPETSDEGEGMTFVDVSWSAEDFIYNYGTNPFRANQRIRARTSELIMACTAEDPILGIEKGTFYRDYDRPYASANILQGLGITKTWEQAEKERDVKDPPRGGLRPRTWRGQSLGRRRQMSSDDSHCQILTEENVYFTDHRGNTALMSWYRSSYHPRLPPLPAHVFYMTSPHIKCGDFNGCELKSKFRAYESMTEDVERPRRIEYFFLPNATVDDCINHYRGETTARGTIWNDIANVDRAVEQQWERFLLQSRLGQGQKEESETLGALREKYARPIDMADFQANLPGLPWPEKEGEELLGHYRGELIIYQSADVGFELKESEVDFEGADWEDSEERSGPTARFVRWDPVPDPRREEGDFDPMEHPVFVGNDCQVNDGTLGYWLWRWGISIDDRPGYTYPPWATEAHRISEQAMEDLEWEVWWKHHRP